MSSDNNQGIRATASEVFIRQSIDGGVNLVTSAIGRRFNLNSATIESTRVFCKTVCEVVLNKIFAPPVPDSDMIVVEQPLLHHDHGDLDAVEHVGETEAFDVVEKSAGSHVDGEEKSEDPIFGKLKMGTFGIFRCPKMGLRVPKFKI